MRLKIAVQRLAHDGAVFRRIQHADLADGRADAAIQLANEGFKGVVRPQLLQRPVERGRRRNMERGHKDILLEGEPHRRDAEFGEHPAEFRIALDEGVCTVNIWDCDTKLTFAEPVYKVLSTNTKMIVPVSLEKALTHDVSFRMESENTKIFSPQDESYTIPAGETTVQVELKVVAPAVQKRPEVPLVLSEVYGATAGDATDLTMTFRLNKGAWSVAYVSSEEDVQDGPATAAKLIDDNEDTFWHNKWYGVDCVVPFEAVIDLSSDYVLDFVEVVRRKNNADTKKVEIYTTADADWSKAEWKLENTLEFGTDKTDGVRDYQWQEDYPTARYVKVRITQGSASNAASLAELTLHGWLK